MLKIKRNDEVVVIAGKDKGKSGRVIRILTKEQRVVVENINIMKKAVKKTQQNPQGGFIDVELPVHVSNIMLLDKKLNKPARFGVKVLDDGTKVRVSKKSGEVI